MRAYYDLHIHSCLSPCGDDDDTPNNIVNMACLKGLSVIAVADHNSVRNVPAVQRVAHGLGLTVLPAMELTTAEDIHLLCLFPAYAPAEAFYRVVEQRRMRVKNRVNVFGRQLVMDENDEIVGEEEDLLITSSNIPLIEAAERVRALGGVAVPAHIDKTANSVYYTLGGIPPEAGFTAVELSRNVSEEFCVSHRFLSRYRVLRDSDAHYLGDISEPVHYLELDEITPEAVIKFLSKK